MLWDTVYPSVRPDRELADGDVFEVGGATPAGAAHPGALAGRVSASTCRRSLRRRCFTGDTLFQGGPGATGRSYSDFPTIIDSIRTGC